MTQLRSREPLTKELNELLNLSVAHFICDFLDQRQFSNADILSNHLEVLPLHFIELTDKGIDLVDLLGVSDSADKDKVVPHGVVDLGQNRLQLEVLIAADLLLELFDL